MVFGTTEHEMKHEMKHETKRDTGRHRRVHQTAIPQTHHQHNSVTVLSTNTSVIPQFANSILPSISPSKATKVRSSSLTKPFRLHDPRHKRDRVEETDNQLRVCVRTR
jgi:hypothetical protein